MPLAIKTNKMYTYGEYLTWSDDQRWELIEGVPYNMTPAPSRQHQKILTQILKQIADYLQNKKCEVYPAPFEVRFPEKAEKDEAIYTVVQPDISVICDLNKLDEKGCRGAPDFIVEIISPATASKDMKEKLSLYEKHKVKEYWIVYPNDKIVEVFTLTKDKKYKKPKIYTFSDEIRISIFKDLILYLHDL